MDFHIREALVQEEGGETKIKAGIRIKAGITELNIFLTNKLSTTESQWLILPPELSFYC